MVQIKMTDGYEMRIERDGWASLVNSSGKFVASGPLAAVEQECEDRGLAPASRGNNPLRPMSEYPS